MVFFERKEDSKSSDFAVQLLADEKSERAVSKSDGDDKSSDYLSIKIKKIRHNLRAIVAMIMLSTSKESEHPL